MKTIQEIFNTALKHTYFNDVCRNQFMCNAVRDCTSLTEEEISYALMSIDKFLVDLGHDPKIHAHPALEDVVSEPTLVDVLYDAGLCSTRSIDDNYILTFSIYSDWNNRFSISESTIAKTKKEETIEVSADKDRPIQTIFDVLIDSGEYDAAISSGSEQMATAIHQTSLLNDREKEKAIISINNYINKVRKENPYITTLPAALQYMHLGFSKSHCKRIYMNWAARPYPSSK